MPRRNTERTSVADPTAGRRVRRALVDFMEAELTRVDLTGMVSVAATGCQAHCDSGPTMVVYPGPVYYQAMDRERLIRIPSST